MKNFSWIRTLACRAAFRGISENSDDRRPTNDHLGQLIIRRILTGDPLVHRSGPQDPQKLSSLQTGLLRHGQRGGLVVIKLRHILFPLTQSQRNVGGKTGKNTIRIDSRIKPMKTCSGRAKVSLAIPSQAMSCPHRHVLHDSPVERTTTIRNFVSDRNTYEAYDGFGGRTHDANTHSHSRNSSRGTIRNIRDAPCNAMRPYIWP